MNIAINGFGRIGRAIVRTIFNDPGIAKKLNIVAINVGPSPYDYLDVLFKHDSIMGTFPDTVTLTGNNLIIGTHSIQLLQSSNPTELPWHNLRIDCVVDASGKFLKAADAQKHIQSGSKKVVITAPAQEADIMIIPGVNDSDFSITNHHIISLGSCTTNCIAPIIKVLNAGMIPITACFINTVHAYTNDQVILDGAHKDPRRARAAAQNIIPTKTGADHAISRIFPHLQHKIHASALRVPVPIVSFLDLTIMSTMPLSVEMLTVLFKKHSTSTMSSILAISDEPLVSSDFIGNPASCIIDSMLISTIDHSARICAWYDNEWGYSCRVKDFLIRLANNI